MLLVANSAWAQWQNLEEGLDLGRFNSGLRTADTDGDLMVLRIDTDHWILRSHQPEESDGYKGRTAKRWCELGNMVAVINAGMFQADQKTHVGYFKIDGLVVNSFDNDYLSAAAFNPVDPAEPYFRIFDLDEISLGEISARYHNVIQNLRLIKRAGNNRWQPSSDRWQEAALGEDYKGRALFIMCDRRWSMHELNEILMALPLGLVTAQHLEGRVDASMWVQHPKVDSKKLPGNYQRNFVVPNILGVTKRHPQSENSE